MNCSRGLKAAGNQGAEHPGDSEWDEDGVGKQGPEAAPSGEIKPDAPGSGTWDD